MKNATIWISLFLLSFQSFNLSARGSFSIADSTSVMARTEISEAEKKQNEQAQADVLLARLAEIKEMDKSDMTREEKRALRTETNNINAQMSSLGGGVYITAGGLLLILIIVLLLL